MAEQKLEEAALERKRDKTLIMQKDNKISTLEAKLGTSSPVDTKVKQYAALKNPAMRTVQAGVGKITKSSENAEKVVIETISKRPKPAELKGTPQQAKLPKSVDKKPSIKQPTSQDIIN